MAFLLQVREAGVQAPGQETESLLASAAFGHIERQDWTWVAISVLSPTILA